MTMTAQEYRANARQCLSWAESAINSENREAFFALAATWEGGAARIEKSNASATMPPTLRRGCHFSPLWHSTPPHRTTA
jgi:hypothetical protein